MKILPGVLKKLVYVPMVAWGRTPVHWLWKTPKRPMDRIYISTSRLIHRNWKDLPTGILRLIYFYMLAVWPLRVIVLIAKNTSTYGNRVKTRFGIGYLRQILTQSWMGLVRNNDPELYYKYELFTPERRSKDYEYVTGNVASTLFAILNNFDKGSSLEDKQGVAEILQDRGFPAVSQLAVVRDGKVLSPEGNPASPPAEDFIAKPNWGMQGQGIFRFEHLVTGTWKDSRGRELTEIQLRSMLTELAADGDLLIQPRLINHSRILDLTGGGFSTLRIITAMGISGDTEVIAAVLKMPVGAGVADNFAAGGIAAPVDLQTGELGFAVSKKQLAERYEYHPDSRGRIPGRKVPLWNEVVEVARNAHKCFPNFVFLGWDIGITEGGPVIVETNALWDVELIQRPYMSPLGGTKFVEYCVERLACLSSETREQIIE